MSNSDKTYTIEYTVGIELTEEQIRSVAQEDRLWTTPYAAYIAACKAWVEANPERIPLKDQLSPYQMGLLRGYVVAASTGDIKLDAHIEQAKLCRRADITQEALNQAFNGDFDEELGIVDLRTEIRKVNTL